MSMSAYYQARNLLTDFLFKDCVGPVEEQEVLLDAPLDVYACGILWPQRVSLERQNIQPPSADAIQASSMQLDAHGLAALEEDDKPDIQEANQYRPSVMAISFKMPNDFQTIRIRFSAAEYAHARVIREGKRFVNNQYTRIPLDSGWLELHIDITKSLPLFDSKADLRIYTRKAYRDGSRLVTISVENTRSAVQKEMDQNTNALFQCHLQIEGRFLPMAQDRFGGSHQDRLLQNMLYRNRHCFAIGHGCSAAWRDADGKSAVSFIESTFLPQCHVPQMTADTAQNHACFQMSRWTNAWRAEGTQALRTYIDEFIAWRDLQASGIARLSPVFLNTAQDAIEKMGVCIQRISDGIRVLETNDNAWRAFLFANEAMLEQAAKRQRKAKETVRWYPFQLCYLLLCVPDMVDEHAPYRQMVDLLWFPTGGGKTEAYLAVAAFTIFYRRLTSEREGAGVAVMMRYTLRMLTSQQFERAAALICECEFIRRRERIEGGEIAIGLWIGASVTPNHVDRGDERDAKHILLALRNRPWEKQCTSPIQLDRCPHCDTMLAPENAYDVVAGSFLAFCPNESCPFHTGLPIMTVDDDVIKKRPALLIGTIDKFARVAWDNQTGAIFGTDGQNLPPSLIIQDELHLISGPLGSVSGLYELAVDALCSRESHVVKVLASTATVCNAGEQIRALYRRDLFQFPPSGLDSDDMFFARTANAEERPERLYIGLCETGGSLVDAMVRVFGTMTFALQYMNCLGIDTDVIDHFWTNVGYFNSLKELGAADTIILDRVMAYAEWLRRHKFQKDAEHVDMDSVERRYEHDELTSRKSAKEIKDIRQRLDQDRYPSEKAYAYILSSNMLSVGIDISRLGLMTVYGQPKSTSEYIQATSRVGRSKPGLVIVLLRMARARDKSHFEQFMSYHQTLNRHVEPTSVTPFSCRALDKALHAAFVILIRHRIPTLSANNSAHWFRSSRPEVRQIREAILNVVEKNAPDHAIYAREALDNFIEAWNQLATYKGAAFQYALLDGMTDRRDALLVPAETYTAQLLPPTLNSMRNVDTGSGVYLITR